MDTPACQRPSASSDGLSSGVAGIAATTCALLPWPASDHLAPTVAWAVAGSCAGFLLSNFPPAKMFLGDCGSTVLGLSVSFLGLRFYRLPSATGARLLVPLIIAGLPLVDGAFAVVRRVRAGVSPCSGDRMHVYDLLLSRGYSPRTVALTCYGIAIGCSSIGILAERLEGIKFLFLAGALFGTLVIAELQLGAVHADRQGASFLPRFLRSVERTLTSRRW